MISIKEFTVKDFIPDSFKKSMSKEMEKIKSFEKRVNRLFTVLFIVTSALFISLGSLMIQNILQSIGRFDINVAAPLAILISFMVIFLVYVNYRLTNRFCFMAITKYSRRDKEAANMMAKYYLVISFKIGIEDKTVSLVKLKDKHLRIYVEELNQEVDVPMVYNVIDNDDNEIQLFEDHIDILINKDTLNEIK